MKRILPLALCVSLFAAPVWAGEVDVPGKTPPPPCTECATTSETEPVESGTDAITMAILEALLTPIVR